MDRFPLPVLSEDFQRELEELVDFFSGNDQENADFMKEKMNDVVYDAYGINTDERIIITNSIY